jgi:2-oxoglutarate/2-oxoacid ferredoxin oxidoreductase subunit beta
VGSKLKTGIINDLPPVDCCLAGIQMGATFVARSFSGDKRQLQSILKAAFSHKGLSIIDVVSPCTTFNDHDGSTKSYSYMKDHEEPLHEIDFVPAYEDITVEYEEGSVREVELHDGSRLRLKKVGRDYDPRDKLGAICLLNQCKSSDEVATGVLYIDFAPTFIERLQMVDEPLATLPESRIRPSKEALGQIMEELR